MQAQRAGTNRLIEARLRTYNEALNNGATREEAMAKAKSVTRKEVAAARKAKS